MQQVLSQESEESVQLSLRKIPAIYREVLVLRFQEELQIDEMAGVLSVPISTVKSRLYRGLEALRGALQGVWLGEKLDRLRTKADCACRCADCRAPTRGVLRMK